MNLPVPSTRSGYVVAILMTLIWMLLYYYSPPSSNLLYNIYSHSMYTSGLSLLSNNHCKELPVTIRIRLPKHSSELIPGYIYLHVKNDQDTRIEKLVISVSGTGEKDWFLLPSVYTSNIFPNTARLEDFPPQGVTFLRFPLVFTEVKDVKIYVSVDNSNYVCELNAGGEKLGPSGFGALQRAIVENLLLPPWSNLFIPTFVFVLVYLLESDDKGELDKLGGKTISLFIWAFIESLLAYEILKTFLLNQGFLTLLVMVSFILLLFWNHLKIYLSKTS